MTDKEYVKTISQRSTSQLLEDLYDYGYDNYYRDLYNVTMLELKKRATWYKVEDKLPEYCRIVLVAMHFYDTVVYHLASLHNSNDKDWWAFDTDLIAHEDDIIAWTYIPLYEEQK